MLVERLCHGPEGFNELHAVVSEAPDIVNSARDPFEVDVREPFNYSCLAKNHQRLSDGSLVVVVRRAPANQLCNVVCTEAEELSKQFESTAVGVIEL